LNQNENDIKHALQSHVTLYKFLFWVKGGAQGNYLHKYKDFCRFLLKMGNFASLLPVSSDTFTPELFLKQNGMDINDMMSSKRLSEVI
jgi:hypothetical protein